MSPAIESLLLSDTRLVARSHATSATSRTTGVRAPLMKMPTRIVVGDEDYATPVAMSETLHRGIAGSTLTVIKNARHLTPLECPERVAAELRALFEMAPAR